MTSAKEEAKTEKILPENMPELGRSDLVVVFAEADLADWIYSPIHLHS